MNPPLTKIIALGFALACAMTTNHAAEAGAASKPNILLIVSDDHG